MDSVFRLTKNYSQLNKMAIKNRNINKYKSPETPVWDCIGDIWSSQRSQASDANVNNCCNNVSNGASRIANNCSSDNVRMIEEGDNEKYESDFMADLINVEQRVDLLNDKLSSIFTKIYFDCSPIEYSLKSVITLFNSDDVNHNLTIRNYYYTIDIYPLPRLTSRYLKWLLENSPVNYNI